MPTIQKTIRMYEFIRRVIASNGEAPTMRELGSYFHMSSSASVHEQLQKMEARGWIKRSRRWRGIEIVKQDKEAA
jgi:repressor LexA